MQTGTALDGSKGWEHRVQGEALDSKAKAPRESRLQVVSVVEFSWRFG